MTTLVLHRLVNPRRPRNLLEACCHHDGCAGGTIHEYLPRLSWLYRGNVRGQGPTWYLVLDSDRDSVLGWYAGPKASLPAIVPDMMPGYLDTLYDAEPME